MQNIKNVIYSLFFIIILGGCSFNIPQTSKEEMQKIITRVNSSKLIILDVYHNQCSDCKLIEPVIEKLKSDYTDSSEISFLRYDLSTPFTIFKSKQIAKALGLEHIYNLQKYSGVVLIIDTQKKHVLDTLIAEHNLNKYNEVIEERLREKNAT